MTLYDKQPPSINDQITAIRAAVTPDAVNNPNETQDVQSALRELFAIVTKVSLDHEGEELPLVNSTTIDFLRKTIAELHQIHALSDDQTEDLCNLLPES